MHLVRKKKSRQKTSSGSNRGKGRRVHHNAKSSLRNHRKKGGHGRGGGRELGRGASGKVWNKQQEQADEQDEDEQADDWTVPVADSAFRLDGCVGAGLLGCVRGIMHPGGGLLLAHEAEWQGTDLAPTATLAGLDALLGLNVDNLAQALACIPLAQKLQLPNDLQVNVPSTIDLKDQAVDTLPLRTRVDDVISSTSTALDSARHSKLTAQTQTQTQTQNMTHTQKLLHPQTCKRPQPQTQMLSVDVLDNLLEPRLDAPDIVNRDDALRTKNSDKNNAPRGENSRVDAVELELDLLLGMSDAVSTVPPVDGELAPVPPVDDELDLLLAM